ncbi:hypothetical protein Syun_017118 [Stephania yunnanensis]|uniref:Uncharacterized protein n=1 Tax=Stephania yunnanensis TaxID=152371 RepID=A0AAP0P5J0_9MAGN
MDHKYSSIAMASFGSRGSSQSQTPFTSPSPRTKNSTSFSNPLIAPFSNSLNQLTSIKLNCTNFSF